MTLYVVFFKNFVIHSLRFIIYKGLRIRVLSRQRLARTCPATSMSLRWTRSRSSIPAGSMFSVLRSRVRRSDVLLWSLPLIAAPEETRLLGDLRTRRSRFLRSRRTPTAEALPIRRDVSQQSGMRSGVIRFLPVVKPPVSSHTV